MGKPPPHLAWFLGPKGEMGPALESALVDIVRDYVHWRRNYFPADQHLLPPSRIRELSAEHDQHALVVAELSARLRRDFPFYSPRYLGHQLSDVLIPATIGYVAALLHNPNNVTPEAAPVTVELEVEAADLLLMMLGLRPPPTPPETLAGLPDYLRNIKRTFGWAHLCSGGTAANLEALWAARMVRSFPLSVQEAAQEHGLAVSVRFPTPGRADPPERVDIRDLGVGDLFAIRTNESIYLMERFVDAVLEARHTDGDRRAARLEALALLKTTKASIQRSVAESFQGGTPVILAPRSSHYSIHKAADVLGIGRDQVCMIDTDANFRMSIDHLAAELDLHERMGNVVVAVVGVAGTTEEGSVDPIHKIAALRHERELARKQTFWLHVDAAWGGYLRSLFDQPSIELAERCRSLDVQLESTLDRTHQAVTSHLGDAARERGMAAHLEAMAATADSGDTTRYLVELNQLASRIEPRRAIDGEAPGPFPEIERRAISAFVRDRIKIGFGRQLRTRGVGWGDGAVLDAFGAFRRADSITVDPHKMGYLPYPAGVIAYANDRVRHFMHSRAQYITSDRGQAQEHQPLRRIHDLDAARAAYDAGERGRHRSLEPEIHAMATYTLEGSRPGAAASALWASLHVVRPDWFGYGGIVRSSLLTGRAFYEWLMAWPALLADLGHPHAYRLIGLARDAPDTNIVNFVARPGGSTSIAAMNGMTKAIYGHFSIDSEGGSKAYSYNQPFFLSKTRLEPEQYPVSVLEDFFKRADITAPSEYEEEPIDVLRATLMSPYVEDLRRFGAQDVLHDFFDELHATAMAYLEHGGPSGASTDQGP